MTAFDWVKSNSTLTIGTFFEHLKNPSGDGGGSGENVFLPIEQFSVNMKIEHFDADLDIIAITADMSIETYDANLTENIYSADITMENYDVNKNSC